MVTKDDEQQLVELMTRYQQGDAEAFTALYQSLKGPLQRYLWTFVRNTTIAEDLTQEAFLQIHRARHTYASPRPVRPLGLCDLTACRLDASQIQETSQGKPCGRRSSRGSGAP